MVLSEYRSCGPLESDLVLFSWTGWAQPIGVRLTLLPASQVEE